jgi:hypothetical protein
VHELRGAQERDVCAAEREGVRAGDLAQSVEEPSEVLGSFLAGEVLEDDDRVSQSEGLLHFSPVDVLGGIPQADWLARDLESVVRIEERDRRRLSPQLAKENAA